MVKPDPIRYDEPLSLLSGFRRLSPLKPTVLPLKPNRVRYVYVDKLYDDGSRLSQRILKEKHVESIKYESVEAAHISSDLVVVKCSVKRSENNEFVNAMELRNKIIQTEESASGYADFCLGLCLGAQKQEVSK